MGKLVPLSELATRHGYKNGPSLRRFLTARQVAAKGRAPGRGGESLYDEGEVAAVLATRQQGYRSDIKPPATD